MAAAPERIKATESRGEWRQGARGDRAMRDKGARSPGKHTIKVVSRCDLERPKERFQFCGTVSRIHMVNEKRKKTIVKNVSKLEGG